MIKFRRIKENSNDPRLRNHFLFLITNVNVTSFSKWLRKKGLDELPQIFNVISESMSFVGLHPLIQDDLLVMKNKYFDEYNNRNSLKIKPGITESRKLLQSKNFLRIGF